RRRLALLLALLRPRPAHRRSVLRGEFGGAGGATQVGFVFFFWEKEIKVIVFWNYVMVGLFAQPIAGAFYVVNLVALVALLRSASFVRSLRKKPSICDTP